MATTTNYGWTTPDDTALVKDGAAAIRTLGTSIDTTTKNLNPSTTLGDIEYRSSTANTNTRLGIGTTDQVLTVSGGVPAWVTPSSGGMTLLSTTTLSGSGTVISSINQSYINLFITIDNLSNSNDGTDVVFRFNNDSTANRHGQITSLSAAGSQAFNSTTATLAYAVENGTGLEQRSIIQIPNYANTTNMKSAQVFTFGTNAFNTANAAFVNLNAIYNQNSAISSLGIYPSAGTFLGGTVKIYGVK